MDHDPQNKPGPFAPASAHLRARARRSRRRARNGRQRARLLAGAAADTTAERSEAADCAASGRRAPEHARRRSRPRRRACGRYRSAGPADGDGPAAGRTGSRRAGGDPQASGRRDHRPHPRSPRTHAALQGDRRIDSAVRRRRREARGRGRLYRLYRRRCGGRTPGDLRFQRRAGRGIGLSQYRRARALAAAVRSHHRIGVRKRSFPNAETWLDFTDLVFIDPPGTGYSRLVGGDEARRNIWSVDGDADALAVFIRKWIDQNGRRARRNSSSARVTAACAR